jgi:hypothetical protein
MMMVVKGRGRGLGQSLIGMAMENRKGECLDGSTVLMVQLRGNPSPWIV